MQKLRPHPDLMTQNTCLYQDSQGSLHFKAGEALD